jgi:hypothetical protein
MDVRSIQPTANGSRPSVRALRRRIRLEREPLDHPGRGLVGAGQLAQKQRRLEVLRSQLR